MSMIYIYKLMAGQKLDLNDIFTKIHFRVVTVNDKAVRRCSPYTTIDITVIEQVIIDNIFYDVSAVRFRVS